MEDAPLGGCTNMLIRSRLRGLGRPRPSVCVSRGLAAVAGRPANRATPNHIAGAPSFHRTIILPSCGPTSLALSSMLPTS